MATDFSVSEGEQAKGLLDGWFRSSTACLEDGSSTSSRFDATQQAGNEFNPGSAGWADPMGKKVLTFRRLAKSAHFSAKHAHKPLINDQLHRIHMILNLPNKGRDSI